MNSVEITNLTKRYGNFYAVDNLCFNIKQGDFVGFLGVNGAGKSTTVNMLSTVISPDAGTAYICGKRVGRDDGEIRKMIGVVYQANVLDELFTVEENIRLRARMAGIEEAKINERLSVLSKMLKLSDIMGKKYKVLSGGQKRRCEIVAALMNSPKILFLDEPTTGLDPATRVDVWEAISELRKNTDMTVFLTTHYMEEAQAADQIIVIDKGKKVAEGTPFELKEKYAKDKLKLYFPEDKASGVKETLSGLGGALAGKSLIPEAFGGVVEIKDPFESIGIIEKLRGMIDGFEVLQGNMDDVFLNVTALNK